MPFLPHNSFLSAISAISAIYFNPFCHFCHFSAAFKPFLSHFCRFFCHFGAGCQYYPRRGQAGQAPDGCSRFYDYHYEPVPPSGNHDQNPACQRGSPSPENQEILRHLFSLSGRAIRRKRG